jgi:hypothetical protein
MKDFRSRTTEVGMTAFGYGKQEYFSGYVAKYYVDRTYLNVESRAGYFLIQLANI